MLYQIYKQYLNYYLLKLNHYKKYISGILYIEYTTIININNNDLTRKILYGSGITLAYNNGTYSFNSTASSGLCLITYICGNNLSGARNYALLKIDGNITQHITILSSDSTYKITSFERDIIITNSGFTLKPCYVYRSGQSAEHAQGISILFIESFIK